MNEYIDRELALSFPFANGRYDHEHAELHYIFGCETYKEWLETLPSVSIDQGVVIDFYGRFRIEPRGVYGKNSNAFVVVYDKDCGKYVEEPGNKHHAYARFKNSDEAIEFLKGELLYGKV